MFVLLHNKDKKNLFQTSGQGAASAADLAPQKKNGGYLTTAPVIPYLTLSKILFFFVFVHTDFFLAEESLLESGFEVPPFPLVLDVVGVDYKRLAFEDTDHEVNAEGFPAVFNGFSHTTGLSLLCKALRKPFKEVGAGFSYSEVDIFPLFILFVCLREVDEEVATARVDIIRTNVEYVADVFHMPFFYITNISKFLQYLPSLAQPRQPPLRPKRKGVIPPFFY